MPLFGSSLINYYLSSGRPRFSVVSIIGILSLFLISTTSSSEIINRINYGVVFRKEGVVQMSREHWLHTFVIKLPEYRYIPEVSGCTGSEGTCSLVKRTAAHINVLRSRSLSHLNETMKQINQLVPQTKLTRQFG